MATHASRAGQATEFTYELALSVSSIAKFGYGTPGTRSAYPHVPSCLVLMYGKVTSVLVNEPTTTQWSIVAHARSLVELDVNSSGSKVQSDINSGPYPGMSFVSYSVGVPDPNSQIWLGSSGGVSCAITHEATVTQWSAPGVSGYGD